MTAVRRARQPEGAGSRRAGGKGRPSPPSGLPQTDHGVQRGGGGPPELVGARDPALLLSPAGCSPAGEGRGERGRIGGWMPCCGIPAQYRAHPARFPTPLDVPKPGGRGDPGLPHQGGAPKGPAWLVAPARAPLFPGNLMPSR